MHAIYSDTHNTYQSESKHSEMDPVRQNLIQRTVRSVHVCVHCTVHNCCTQYYTERKPDNFPSYTRTVTVGHEITAESESLRFVTFVVTFSYLSAEPTDGRRYFRRCDENTKLTGELAQLYCDKDIKR